MKTPPLLPSEVLLRMLRVARVNGTSILVIAGSFALLDAADHDVLGAILGLLVALAGAAEIHGASVISRGRVDGLRWLVGSQLFLLVVILAYCGYRLAFPDLTALRDALSEQKELTDQLTTQLAEKGSTLDEAVRGMYILVYLAVGLLTLIYQGLMARYYARRRGAIEIALSHDDLGLHG